MRKLAFSILLASLLVITAGTGMAQEVFDFYGLRFGMTREEVAVFFPFDAEEGLVGEAGHGISSLMVLFDRNGRLIEIRASYPRPDEELEMEGVRRALREKFLLPVKTSHPQVFVNLDEYSNRAELTLVFISKTIKETNIEYYKKQFLEKLE